MIADSIKFCLVSFLEYVICVWLHLKISEILRLHLQD